MNFKKAISAMRETKGVYTIEQALSHPLRWNAYWMLYSTPEAKDFSFNTDKWLDYVNYIWSKPE